MGIGNSWKCLRVVLRKIDEPDHLIEEVDASGITVAPTVLNSVLSLNYLQAITIQYLVSEREGRESLLQLF